MKIKCYDKYNKQHLIFDLAELDDKINVDTFNSNYCNANTTIVFRIDDDTEDPSPERWSDLTDFKIIE